MRVLHVVQLRPQVATWFRASRPDDVTGLAGVLLLQSLIASTPEHQHVVTLLGVEDDAASLAREGLTPACVVSPALLQPRAAAGAVTRLAERVMPSAVIAWGASAAACVDALPAWLVRAAIDLRLSEARRLASIATPIALPAADISPFRNPAKDIARRSLALPDDGLCVLGLQDVATPLDLHHLLYALGSATVAGHRVVLCLAPDAKLDADLLSLVRAQHYVRDIRVIDASVRTLASACDAAVAFAPLEQGVGVAATRTLLHTCVSEHTPVFMLRALSDHLALPSELFSPVAHRGNHTDIAGFLTRAGDHPTWLLDLGRSQHAWLSRYSATTLRDALLPLLTPTHAVHS